VSDKIVADRSVDTLESFCGRSNIGFWHPKATFLIGKPGISFGIPVAKGNFTARFLASAVAAACYDVKVTAIKWSKAHGTDLFQAISDGV
jgi:hypothetical protein